MPRPPDRGGFESARMKIRRGTLAQTRRVRPGDTGPAEPDEIFEFDAAKDLEQDQGEEPELGVEARWRLRSDGTAEQD